MASFEFVPIPSSVITDPAYTGKSVSAQTAGSSSSLTTGNFGPITAGNTVVLRVSFQAATDTITVSDSLGNTYVQILQTDQGKAATIAAYYSNITTGGTGTITVSTASAHTFLTAYAEEWSGFASLPVAATKLGTSAAATSWSDTIATTQAQTVIFAGTAWTAAQGVVTLGANYSSNSAGGLANIGAEFRQVNAANVANTAALSWVNSVTPVWGIFALQPTSARTLSTGSLNNSASGDIILGYRATFMISLQGATDIQSGNGVHIRFGNPTKITDPTSSDFFIPPRDILFFDMGEEFDRFRLKTAAGATVYFVYVLNRN